MDGLIRKSVIDYFTHIRIKGIRLQCFSGLSMGGGGMLTSLREYNARAKDIRCFCPSLRLTPLSLINDKSPMGRLSKSFRLGHG